MFLMDKNKNTHVKILNILALVVFAWWILLQFSQEHAGSANFLFNVAYGLIWLYAGIWGIFWVRKCGRTHRFCWPFLFFSLAALADALGQFLWTYYNFQGIEVPSPSVADVSWLLSYPFIWVGLLILLKQSKQGLDTIRLMLLWLLPLGVLIFGVDLMYPLIKGADPVVSILNLSYFAFDLIQLAIGLVVLSICIGSTQVVVLLVAIAGFIGGLADLVYSARVAQEVYWNGDLSDLGFAIAAYLLALAIFNFPGKSLQVEKNP